MITRYLYAYGPATPQQFGQWIGAPPTGGRAIRAAQPKTHQDRLRRRAAWVSYRDTEMPAAEDAKGGVLLLPYFDAYAVGSHPRDRLFPGKAAARALAPSGQAGNYPVLLIDGVVAGVGISVAPAGRLRSRSSRSSGLPPVSTGLWQLKSNELARSSREMLGLPSGRSPSEGTLEL